MEFRYFMILRTLNCYYFNFKLWIINYSILNWNFNVNLCFLLFFLILIDFHVKLSCESYPYKNMSCDKEKNYGVLNDLIHTVHWNFISVLFIIFWIVFIHNRINSKGYGKNVSTIVSIVIRNFVFLRVLKFSPCDEVSRKTLKKI